MKGLLSQYGFILFFFQVCTECAEEFCSGTCKNFQYDSYQRLIIEEREKDGAGAAAAAGQIDKIGGMGGRYRGGRETGRTSRTDNKKKHSGAGKKKRSTGEKGANLLASMPI